MRENTFFEIVVDGNRTPFCFVVENEEVAVFLVQKQQIAFQVVFAVTAVAKILLAISV